MIWPNLQFVFQFFYLTNNETWVAFLHFHSNGILSMSRDILGVFVLFKLKKNYNNFCLYGFDLFFFNRKFQFYILWLYKIMHFKLRFLHKGCYFLLKMSHLKVYNAHLFFVNGASFDYHSRYNECVYDLILLNVIFLTTEELVGRILKSTHKSILQYIWSFFLEKNPLIDYSCPI